MGDRENPQTPADSHGGRDPVHNFRDLRVWQGAMELVENVYRVTEGFPQKEIYGLTSQIRRAAVSVPSNIAEGHTRAHTKEFLHHLSIAHASLAELDTQLDILARLKCISQSEYNEMSLKMVGLGRQLFALRNALQRKLR